MSFRLRALGFVIGIAAVVSCAAFDAAPSSSSTVGTISGIEAGSFGAASVDDGGDPPSVLSPSASDASAPYDGCTTDAGPCVIECSPTKCPAVMNCPAGRDCIVHCAGKGSCSRIICAREQRCIVRCDDSDSCLNVSFEPASATSVCTRCGAGCDYRCGEGIAGYCKTGAQTMSLGCDSECATHYSECDP